MCINYDGYIDPSDSEAIRIYIQDSKGTDVLSCVFVLHFFFQEHASRAIPMKLLVFLLGEPELCTLCRNRRYKSQKIEVLLPSFQVDVDATSLNSNDVFVLKLPSNSGYTWIGKGASREEEKGAQYVASVLKCQTSRIEEGREPG